MLLIDTNLSDRQALLAGELSRARSVKEAARIRARCTLKEWKLILKEAKKIYRHKNNLN